jgi:hypothetical protein
MSLGLLFAGRRTGLPKGKPTIDGTAALVGAGTCDWRDLRPADAAGGTAHCSG